VQRIARDAKGGEFIVRRGEQPATVSSRPRGVHKKHAAGILGRPAGAARPVQEQEVRAQARTRGDLRRGRSLLKSGPRSRENFVKRFEVPIQDSGVSPQTDREISGNTRSGTKFCSRKSTLRRTRATRRARNPARNGRREGHETDRQVHIVFLAIFLVAWPSAPMYRSTCAAERADEVLQHARIMMDRRSPTRGYTSKQVRPLLETQIKYQSAAVVPAYRQRAVQRSAQEVRGLRLQGSDAQPDQSPQPRTDWENRRREPVPPGAGRAESSASATRRPAAP